MLNMLISETANKYPEITLEMLKLPSFMNKASKATEDFVDACFDAESDTVEAKNKALM